MEQPFESVSLDGTEKASHSTTLAETNHNPVTKYLGFSQIILENEAVKDDSDSG